MEKTIYYLPYANIIERENHWRLFERGTSSVAGILIIILQY
ncbi:hypothetical protein [Heyndrickxia oleronia]|nr:hypothetical protein [Heyndrickxia oleronia]